MFSQIVKSGKHHWVLSENDSSYLVENSELSDKVSSLTDILWHSCLVISVEFDSKLVYYAAASR